MSPVPSCRACGSALSVSFADLGSMPLANSYPPDLESANTQNSYPLHVRVCPDCFLAQADDSVEVHDIFTDYAYMSSYSSSWVEHARQFALKASDCLELTGDSLVVEVASNDGYLLQHFVAAGIPVLGIDPAANIAPIAEEKGVPTITDFFGEQLARQLAREGRQADLIAANNVLAHTPHIRDFVAGFQHLLKPEGVVSVEFPHLLNLIDKCQFDTIYHEHFSYLSLLAVRNLFSTCGLRVFDVEQLETHGGSLRVWACRAEDTRPDQPGLDRIMALEAAAGIDRIETYQNFMPKVEQVRAQLRAFIDEARNANQKVVAYGAAAKGSTLLNYCEVSSNDIAYAVDANPAKQGCVMPGSKIEIRAPEALMRDRPDYILILPWNIADEITGQLMELRAAGTRFYAAIPNLREIA